MKEIKFKDSGVSNKYWLDWMMKERHESQSHMKPGKPLNSKGDLQRTAMYFVAYGHDAFFRGIEKCIEETPSKRIKIWNSIVDSGKNKYNETEKETVCRVVWALKLKKQQTLIDKISKSYSGNDKEEDELSFMDYLWLKSLSTSWGFLRYFQLHIWFWILLSPFIVFMNEKDFLTRCMQVSVCRKSFLQKLLCKLYLLKSDPTNLLSCTLLGEKIHDKIIEELEPRAGFQFDSKYKNFHKEWPYYRKLKEDEFRHNELDKYLVFSVKECLNPIKHK